MILFALLYLFFFWQQQAEGFATERHHIRGVKSLAETRLFLSSSSPLDSELENLERARASFEALFWQEQERQKPRAQREDGEEVLTCAGRHRRKLEILLLESLGDSDDAIDELMHLWVYERDAKSAAALVAMEEQCSRGLIEEEAALRAMIQAHPKWAEPRCRLGDLLYMKGRTEESFEMALKTLEMKPWHFEAVQMLILLALRQQDMGEALYWARQALPPLKEANNNKRRRAWVHRAVEQAKLQLQEADRLTALKSEDQLLTTEEEVWQ